jgi:hypothetical protein
LFDMITLSLNNNLRSNVKESSLAESRIYHSISQLSIHGVFLSVVWRA